MKSRMKCRAFFVVFLLLIGISSFISPSILQIPTVEADVEVGTSTATSAVWLPFQRKCFYANSLLWVFYSDGTNMVYRTSADGITWSGSTTIKAATSAGYFSIWFDDTYMHYALAAQSKIYYRRGTPAGNGTISWSAVEQIISTTWNRAEVPFVSVDSSGYVWIGYEDSYSDYYPFVIKSGNNNGTWGTTPSGFPYQLSTTAHAGWDVSAIPLTGNKMLAVYTYSGTTVKAQRWDGSSWGAERVTTSANKYGYQHSAVAQGDDVHLTFLKSSGYDVLYAKYDYSSNSFGAETTLQTGLTTTSAPYLSIDTSTNNLYVLWAISSHVYYRKYTDTWGSVVDWITSASGLTANNKLACSYETWGNKTCLVYQTGGGSPYSVKFALNTPTFNSAFSITDFDDTNNLYAQKKDYTITGSVSDTAGYAEIETVDISFMSGATVRATITYTEDTDTFSVTTGVAAVELGTGSSAVRSGNDISLTVKFRAKWGATEESGLSLKVVTTDVFSGCDTDTYSTNADFIKTLTVSGFESDPEENVSAPSLVIFSGDVRYVNNPSSSTPSSSYPPNAEFTSVSVHDVSHVVKGTDTSIVNGAFNLTVVSPTVAGQYTYHPFIDMIDSDYVDSDVSGITDTITVVAAGEYWLTGWLYRKSHVINQTAEAGTGYQVNMTVFYSFDTDNGSNVYLDSKCRTDFGDIRFTDSDGVTLLPYWIQSKTDGVSAVFWTKVADDLALGNVTLYVYYGNSGATSISNEDDTFIFAELFDSASLNTTKWTSVDGTPTYSINSTGHYLEVTDMLEWDWGKGFHSRTDLVFTNNRYIIEDAYSFQGQLIQHKSDVGNHVFGAIISLDDDPYAGLDYGVVYGLIWDTDTTTANYRRAGGVNGNLDWQEGPLSGSFGVWYSIRTRAWKLSDGNARVEINGVLRVTEATSVIPNRVHMGIQRLSGWTFGNERFYAFKIRKYVDPEPTHGDWGEEEAAGGVSSATNVFLEVVNAQTGTYLLPKYEWYKFRAIVQYPEPVPSGGDEYLWYENVGPFWSPADAYVLGTAYSDAAAIMPLIDTVHNVRLGVIFQDVLIPQGATIVEAYIRMSTAKNSLTSGTGLTTRIRAIDIDNFDSRWYEGTLRDATPLTTAYADWDITNFYPADPIWVSTYNTTDIKTVVQEIVSRSGWGSGNKMAFVFDANVGGGRREMRALDDGEFGLYSPYRTKLYVKYQVESGGGSGSGTPAYENIDKITIAFSDGTNWINATATRSTGATVLDAGSSVATVTTPTTFFCAGEMVMADIKIMLDWDVSGITGVSLYMKTYDTVGNHTGWEVMQSNYINIEPDIAVTGFASAHTSRPVNTPESVLGYPCYEGFPLCNIPPDELTTVNLRRSDGSLADGCDIEADSMFYAWFAEATTGDRVYHPEILGSGDFPDANMSSTVEISWYQETSGGPPTPPSPPPPPEEPNMYTLTIDFVGRGSTLPVVGSYSYPENIFVEVSAYPAEGWYFDGWKGLSSDRVVEVQMTGNIYLLGTFKEGIAPPEEPTEPIDLDDLLLQWIPPWLEERLKPFAPKNLPTLLIPLPTPVAISITLLIGLILLLIVVVSIIVSLSRKDKRPTEQLTYSQLWKRGR